MTPACLTICEKSDRWTVAVRWALAGSGITVQQIRSLEEYPRHRDAPTYNLLALEMRKENTEQVCRGLLDLAQHTPESGTIILTDRQWREQEWALWELGALYVATSRRNLAPLANLVQRFFGKQEQAERDPTKSVWGRLPWPKADRP